MVNGKYKYTRWGVKNMRWQTGKIHNATLIQGMIHTHKINTRKRAGTYTQYYCERSVTKWRKPKQHSN